MISFLINILCTVIVAILISIYFRKGKDQLLKIIILALKELPGVNSIIGLVLKNEVSGFVKTTSLAEDVNRTRPRVVIPDKGLTVEELRKQMAVMKKRESKTEEEGNVFAYTYTVFNEHFKLQQEAFDIFSESTGHSLEQDAIVNEFFHGFMHENALNPMIYPALRLMETEIVSMTAAMLNGNSSCVGFLTSGGTESNLMAVKAYRDRAAKLYPNIKTPNIVAPITVHPTIDKGGHYFGLEVKHTPVTAEFIADVQAMEEAIDSNTVMLVASAPQFCHGVIDPIEAIAALARRKGIPLHVDCCFGGFMLPWVEQLGYPVPKFDFRCAGVTSISADVHKYGYSVKGASVIVYVNDDYRRHQIYAYSEWPGGLYGSPSMAGTRPGGNIGAAWAAMKALGEDGYKAKAKALMDVTQTMITRIKSINGLRILGNPAMTAFAIGSVDSSINIQAVADDMEKRGWKMERNQNPDSIHCSILPHHIPVHEKFLDDMEKATDFCRNNTSLNKKGTAGVYGMMASIPDKGIVTDFLVEFFSEVYKCK